ncbi:phage major tail tube protein [Paenibacillus taichungensis]|uniref:phage major tail tube protein n=1 Tax=Paenibacillus taichungensis TaxID=484184 RepID=UPI0037F469F7
MKNIPIKLAGMALFLNDNKDSFATADITLPNLTPMTTTVSGMGILGEVDLPDSGHYSSILLGINWRTIAKEAFALVGSSIKKLEIRGAFKEFDVSGTQFVTKAIKIVVTGVGKGIDLGTLAQNAETGTSNSVEVIYIKIFIEGENVFELDKFAYVSKVNGVDEQEDVRKALGLA